MCIKDLSPTTAEMPIDLGELDLLTMPLYRDHPLYSVERHAHRIDAYANEILVGARRRGRRLQTALRAVGSDSVEGRRLLDAELPEMKKMCWEIKMLRKTARRLQAMAPFVLLGVELHEPATRQAGSSASMMLQ